MNSLAVFGFWHYLITTALVIICILLMIVILLQKGRGGGIGAAFGGGGHSAFGTKTGDVFTWVTVVLAMLYLLTVIVGNYIFVPSGAASGQDIQTVEPTPTDQTALPTTQPRPPATSPARTPATAAARSRAMPGLTTRTATQQPARSGTAAPSATTKPAE
jgi:preprotein translocase subunit SecG